MKLFFMAVTGRLGESGSDAEDFDVIDLYLKSFKKNVLQQGIESKVLMWNGADVSVEQSILQERIHHYNLQNTVEIITPEKAGVSGQISEIKSKGTNDIHGWVINTINDYAYEKCDWNEYDLIISTDSDVYFDKSFKEEFEKYVKFSELFDPTFIGILTECYLTYQIGRDIKNVFPPNTDVLKKDELITISYRNESNIEKTEITPSIPRFDSAFHVKSSGFWKRGHRLNWKPKVRLMGRDDEEKFREEMHRNNFFVNFIRDTGSAVSLSVLFKNTDIKSLILNYNEFPIKHYGKVFWDGERRKSFDDWRNEKIKQLNENH